MTDKYLWDTYRTQFKVEVYEDGVAYIQTRIKPRDGTTFDVYQYSNTHLAACLPVRLACKLLDTHSTAFRVHQSAEDCTVLLFAESRLEEVADVLRLKRRRKLSPEQRAKLAAASAGFRFKPGAKGP